MNSPSPPASAADFLLAAMNARTPYAQLKFAQAGIPIGGLDGDTHVLLLREQLKAHLLLRQFRSAVEVATQMTEVGALPDLAYHELSRAQMILGDVHAAVRNQRLAARQTTASKRSFHLWSLAVIQHAAGMSEDALSTLNRALRCSTRDRQLVKAQYMFVQLELGITPFDQKLLWQELREDPPGGYGNYVMGMIANYIGDTQNSKVWLDEFVRRNDLNESDDPDELRVQKMRALTLHAELEQAKRVLLSFV